MSLQPASRTKFYRNKQDAKVSGVCAGIADYTGLDVTLVRIMMLFALFMSGGGVFLCYLLAAMIAPKRPASFDYENSDERRFWQGVRASPGRSARQIRSQLRDINRRIGDVESYVLTENRSLAREIEELR